VAGAYNRSIQYKLYTLAASVALAAWKAAAACCSSATMADANVALRDTTSPCHIAVAALRATTSKEPPPSYSSTTATCTCSTRCISGLPQHQRRQGNRQTFRHRQRRTENEFKKYKLLDLFAS
jgi:hypothetical protein